MRRFNKEEMLKSFKSDAATAFDGFDYIDYKYRSLLKGLEGKASILKKEFLRYERSNAHNLYEKIEYNRIYKNLKLIYNDPDEAESFVFLYDFTLDQLVDRYLNISPLNKLYSYHFFEYEWEQHVDMNFKENKLSFYRDHFMHQIRNCYMIISYLDFKNEGDSEDDTYYKKIELTLKERANSISQYACAQVEQYKAVVKSKISERIRDGNNQLSWDEEKLLYGNIGDFSWNYLIRGSLIVAALFHDIGYPIRYTYKSIDAIKDYISMISPADNIGFDKLNNLLEGSLLFTVADKKGMKAQYDSLDHGALSAFTLLMQFYQNGAIYDLNPIKRGIIELAAVIIYDHTVKYRFLGDKDSEKCDVREKPSFKENPLSYTLRFIDDIQEWDRIYFEIREGSSFKYCEKCKMPIVSVWNNFAIKEAFADLESLEDDRSVKEDMKRAKGKITERISQSQNVSNIKDLLGQFFFVGYVNDPSIKKIDVCGCNNYSRPWTKPYYSSLSESIKSISAKINGHHFSPGNVESGSFFHYQKINYIMTCDDVILLRRMELNEDTGKRYRLDTFYIDYNPYSQLHLLLLNHKSLQYRIKENAKLIKQFNAQLDISITARTQITDNPMMLKLRILAEFLYETGFYVNIRADMINVDDGNNSSDEFPVSLVYARNLIYYGVFGDYMYWATPKIYEALYKVAHCLKEKGFFVYDYEDEGVFLKPTDCKPGPEDWTVVEDFLEHSVRSLMYPEELQTKEETAETFENGRNKFLQNLVNTVKCYFNILKRQISSEVGTEGDTLTACEFKYIDKSHKDACNLIFSDCMSQLRYQSDATMEEYYDLRSEKSERERVRSDAYCVIDEKSMENALDIVFDTKYYNPAIIRNESVNENGFTFFDIYSDLYLIKEMARFTSDNRRRRLRKNNAG